MPILNCPCRFYTCNFQERIQLYIVLDGHDGTKACEFAQKHLPSVLLQSELEGGTEVVGRALRHAFLHTEREFFLRIDPQITRKITLQIEIQVSHCTCISALNVLSSHLHIYSHSFMSTHHHPLPPILLAAEGPQLCRGLIIIPKPGGGDPTTGQRDQGWDDGRCGPHL